MTTSIVIHIDRFVIHIHIYIYVYVICTCLYIHIYIYMWRVCEEEHTKMILMAVKVRAMAVHS